MHPVNQRLITDVSLQEEKYSKAFRSAPFAVMLTRISDGTIMEVNEGFVRVSGFSPAEAIGRTTLELGLWAQEEDRQAVVARLVREGRVEGLKARFRRHSGETFNGLFSAEVLTINSDISVRKEMEHEREQLIADLQKALAEVKALSGILPICPVCAKPLYGDLADEDDPPQNSRGKPVA